MSINTVSDLGHSLLLRRDTSRLTTEVQRLAGELSSGTKSDLVSDLKGDYRILAGLERSLESISAFEVPVKEASLAASASQSALGKINSSLSTIKTTIIGLDTALDATSLATIGHEARESFEVAISALNTQVAGRSVFSGRAFSSVTVVDAKTILSDVAALAAGATTALDVDAVVDSYFSIGGAFQTSAYQGSNSTDPIQVGDNRSIQPLITATDERIMVVLKGLASAAMLSFGLPNGNVSEQVAVARMAGVDIAEAEAQLVDARAEVGSIEGALASVQTLLASDRSSIEISILEITSVDPYQTASELRYAEEQLQSLFVIAGRLSSLSLSAYL